VQTEQRLFIRRQFLVFSFEKKNRGKGYQGKGPGARKGGTIGRDNLLSIMLS